MKIRRIRKQIQASQKNNESDKMRPLEYEEMKALNMLRSIYSPDNKQYNLDVIA